MYLYLGLGSNIGDRENNLKKAIIQLDTFFNTKALAISGFYYSKAWEFIGNDFVNCVVKYDIETDPYIVLKYCKSIEKSMGREETLEYGPDNKRIYHNRIIDIDILQYGNLIINTEELTIPHPLMNQRDFVMIPLKEIQKI